MQTALYIRVSTDEQAREGFSIEAQRSMLQRKASELNMTVVKAYIDDGYSAKDMKRPALQQLIKDVERQQFEVVFFWRLDRLTRKSRDFHKLTEILHKHKVGLKSSTEQIDTTTAIGRFQLELSVSLAQLERETISERVFFVMEERIRKGLRNGAPAPIGYVLEDKKLKVNPDSAQLVKLVFDMYLDGTGFKSIAHTMNRMPEALQHIPLWSGPGVKYMLQNPVYIGKIRWNYIDKSNQKTKKEIIVDADHEPIIDEVTFQRVQNAISRRAKGGKRFTNDYLFSSVLVCARCGSHMHGQSYTKGTGKQYRSYRCGGKHDHGICTMSNMRENGVIDAFLSALDLREAELEKHLNVNYEEDEDAKRLDSMKKELEVIAKRKKRWQLAYASEAITLEELRAHTDEDRLREEFLKKQLDSQQIKTKSHWTSEELIQQLKQLREAWYLIDNDKAKKLFIQEAFEYIKVDLDPNSRHGIGCRTKVIITDFRFRA